MADFTIEANRTLATRKVRALMEEAYNLIQTNHEDARHFYSLHAHHFLMKHAWEILVPTDFESWDPRLKKLEYDEGFMWPYMTNYAYCMNVNHPPNLPWTSLTFGYAVLKEKLVRTTFFTGQGMVEYQPIPQGFVCDPLAHRSNIHPEYYIGCTVCSEQYIRNFPAPSKQNPFEVYVKKEGHLMKEL